MLGPVHSFKNLNFFICYIGPVHSFKKLSSFEIRHPVQYMYSSRKTPAKVCSTCIGVYYSSVTFNEWQMNQISLRCTAPFRFCSGCALRLLNTLNNQLSTYRLQIFLVKYGYLRLLQLYEERGIHGKLTKRVCKYLLAILPTYMQTRIYHSENKYVT